MNGGELILFVHRELLPPPFMPLRFDRSYLILNAPKSIDICEFTAPA